MRHRRRSPAAAIAIASSLGVHLALVLLLPVFVAQPLSDWPERVHELEVSSPARPAPSAALEPAPILIPQLGDPSGRSAKGAVETVQAPVGPSGAHGSGEPAPRPAARVGGDLDDLRFAPYNHPSNDLSATSTGAAQVVRRPGFRPSGRRAVAAAERREPAPYLRTSMARAEGSTSAATGSAPAKGSPGTASDRLSRIPKDGEVSLPEGFRVATATRAPHDRREASSKRSSDLIDASRPSGGGQGVGAGRGAAASRRGSPDGAEHGAPLWLTGGDRRYTDYFRRIYRKVQPLWVFPKQLEVVYEQGEVIVGFSILADGTVRDLRVFKSSGYRQFDANVVAAIEKAAPFGPIPQGLGRKLQILAPFEFANPMVR